MRVEYEENRVIFHFHAPATVEIGEDFLRVPNREDLREIVLDFQGVKIISSMVIARLLMLLHNEEDRRTIRMVNMSDEMRNLINRTGLTGWNKYISW